MTVHPEDQAEALRLVSVVRNSIGGVGLNAGWGDHATAADLCRDLGDHLHAAADLLTPKAAPAAEVRRAA